MEFWNEQPAVLLLILMSCRWPSARHRVRFRSCLVMILFQRRVTAFLSSPPPFSIYQWTTTLIPSLNNMSDDEMVIPELPCFPPPPLEDVLRDLDNLDIPEDVQIPTLLDFDMSCYQDLSTLSLTSSSESIYSTGLTGDISNSENSFMTYTTSNYPPLFDFALREIIDSGYSYVDPQSFVFSDSPMIPDSVGTPQLYPQYDHDRLNRFFVGISPHCLSAAFQSPPPAVPIYPPVGGASTTQVFTGPIRTKFTCLQCGHCMYNFYHIPSTFEILNVSLQSLVGNPT